MAEKSKRMLSDLQKHLIGVRFDHLIEMGKILQPEGADHWRLARPWASKDLRDDVISHLEQSGEPFKGGVLDPARVRRLFENLKKMPVHPSTGNSTPRGPRKTARRSDLGAVAEVVQWLVEGDKREIPDDLADKLAKALDYEEVAGDV